MLKHFLTLCHGRFILQRLWEWMPSRSRSKYTSAELIAFVSAPSVWVTHPAAGAYLSDRFRWTGGLTAYSIEEIQQMRDFLNATRLDSDKGSLLMSGRGFTRGASNMAKVVLDISMSLDGFVAGLSDTVKSPLHDWLFNGDTPSKYNDFFKLSKKSAKVFDELVRNTGSIITGRRTYNITGGGEEVILSMIQYSCFLMIPRAVFQMAGEG